MSPVPDADEAIAFVTIQNPILTGRTRIDAAVAVDDAFVEVDEDGLFTIELNLEEGPNIIEVLASVVGEDELSLVLIISYEPEG